MEGAWDTPDLDAVLDLGIANLKPVDHSGSTSPRRSRRMARPPRQHPHGKPAHILITTTSATTSTGCGSTARWRISALFGGRD